MRFTPKTDQEIAEQNLIPKGVYHFEVLEASNQISKSGNEMIKLKLKVWTHDGKERVMFDYLLEAFAKKIKHFCEITGQLDKYETGCLFPEDCIFKMGKVEVGVEVGKPNDKGGMYPDKNTILDYIKSEADAAPATDKKADVPFDDDVPF